MFANHGCRRATGDTQRDACHRRDILEEELAKRGCRFIEVTHHLICNGRTPEAAEKYSLRDWQPTPEALKGGGISSHRLASECRNIISQDEEDGRPWPDPSAAFGKLCA